MSACAVVTGSVGARDRIVLRLDFLSNRQIMTGLATHLCDPRVAPDLQLCHEAIGLFGQSFLLPDNKLSPNQMSAVSEVVARD